MELVEGYDWGLDCGCVLMVLDVLKVDFLTGDQILNVLVPSGRTAIAFSVLLT
jgi:hypothetical protein